MMSSPGVLELIKARCRPGLSLSKTQQMVEVERLVESYKLAQSQELEDFVESEPAPLERPLLMNRGLERNAYLGYSALRQRAWDHLSVLLGEPEECMPKQTPGASPTLTHACHGWRRMVLLDTHSRG